MEQHHTILFPAFLILFASFLAFSIDTLDFVEVVSREASPITGYAVVAGASCETEDSSVLGLYVNSNSHVFMMASGASTGLCAQVSSALTVVNLTRQCDIDLANLVAYVSNGTQVPASAKLTNSHIYGPETSASNLPPSGFYVPVCYDGLECKTSPSCELTEECLLSFEGDLGVPYNAHAADCGTYTNQLCCKKSDADFCGPVDCDFFDADYGQGVSQGLLNDTIREAEVSLASCSVGCSGISCCEQTTVKCDGNPTKQCKKFYDLIGYPNLPYDNPDVSNAMCYKSNSGSFLWGFPGAEITEISCGDLFDNDCDGLKDAADSDCSGVSDNCPFHPNDGGLGTCITAGTLSNPDPTLDVVANGLTCSSDADCMNKTIKGILVEHCELTQANADGGATFGDACGNACDLDSNDANTCITEGDQGGTLSSDCAGALTGASFKWVPTGPVERGDLVEIVLDLAGSSECDGITFGISVINPDAALGDLDYLSNVDPSPLTVTGSVGKTSWYAENNNPGPNPVKVKWKAKGFNIGGLVVPPSTILEVTATDSYCGDGDKDVNSGEQCDDGNTKDDDGCSKSCLIEGLDGAGDGSDDCSSYCVKGTSVCAADGLYYCGDYNGDGCNELKFGDACAGKICNADFGNCVSPSCTVKNLATEVNPSCSAASGFAWVCGSWSNCVNGQRTRVCNECISGACSLKPIEGVGCSIEPSVKGSFFDLWSTLLAVMIIGLYYVFRKSKMHIH